MKDTPEAPWRKIVKHDQRTIQRRGRSYARMVDTLECGHSIECNNWHRGNHPNARVGKGHNRRRCKPCRDGAPHIPVEEDDDW
jgi:hypothetical protein